MAFTSEQRAAHRAKQKLVTQSPEGDNVTPEVTLSNEEVTSAVTQPVIEVTPTTFTRADAQALLDGTPDLARTVVSTPTLQDDPRFTYIDDPDDPIIGQSALTARMAITQSGKLVDTRKLSKEQMVAAGIWLGPNPADSDFKTEKAPKARR